MFGQHLFVELDTPLYDSRYIVRNTYIAVLIQCRAEWRSGPEPIYLVSSSIKKARWQGVSSPYPSPSLPLQPGNYTAFNILHSALDFKVKELWIFSIGTRKIDSSFSILNNGVSKLEYRMLQIPLISKCSNVTRLSR